jgi:hypothetical protein
VADASPGRRITRRRWFAGLGGALASLPVLWWLDVPGRIRRAVRPAPPAPECCAWVDRDGWMLTPEDAAALDRRQTAK